MNKKEILLINDRIRKDLPEINSYTHVSILRDCVPNDSVIFCNGHHCILMVITPKQRKVNFFDNKGEFIYDIKPYKTLKEYGYDSVRRLVEVDLIKK